MGEFDFDSLEDLVFSRSFRNWVLDKNCPEAEFWENWAARNPVRQDLVRHAKAVIYAMQFNGRKLSGKEKNAEVRKALRRLKDTPFEIDPSSGFSRKLAGATPFAGRYTRLLEWALLLCSICGLAWYFYRHFT
jgi:hypothetical protein